MKYQNIREEELKNKVAQDYFWIYDCTKIMGNVDFCVSMYRTPSTSVTEGVFTPPTPLKEEELSAPLKERELSTHLKEREQETPTTDGATQFPLSEGKQETPTTDGATQFPLSEGVRGSTDTSEGVRGSTDTQADGGFEQESLLWAEAKKGSSNIYHSIVQLILTIGKARTFDKFLPPAMLGAFDGEKIAFIPYNDIHEVFYINDFNWNVTPSNHTTKEFKLIHEKVKTVIDSKALLFNFLTDDRELKKFIKKNFIVGKFGLTKTKIDKNNFMVIYNKWLQAVKPTIAVNWDIAKKTGIIDGDFYLADLLSHENNTLKEKLFVLLKHDHYELDRKLDEAGMFSSKRTDFTDKQVAHTQFWNKYDRPPKEEYWDYIVERRDLLVPQDVRERKGSFFTPQIWVELSQKYLTDVLGEDWQDEYYVWDCAAGTGNLLNGLTNKYHIFASTLDKQDVEVIHDRINNGANLLHDHVFQFDFLNDDFFPLSEGDRGSKLPKPLQDIIKDPEKRRKLVIYINPPYAEAASTATITGHKENKKDVAVQTKIYRRYLDKIGIAGRELYVQFLTRIYCEIPDVKIAQFSTLKTLQAPNFTEFRGLFKANLQSLFVVPANTFDNVKGKFPIGFFIWNTNQKEVFFSILSDVYNENAELIGNKRFFVEENRKSINDWIISTRNKSSNISIGFMSAKGSDFQNMNFVFIINDKNQLPHPRGTVITDGNLLEIGVYYSVRHCIEATWLNDRDQFLHPNNQWETDTEFQNDCLVFTLFNTHIQAQYGTNHWIPFTEQEVNAREKFESNFMTDFIKGKVKAQSTTPDLFTPPTPIKEGVFTPPNPLKEGEQETPTTDGATQFPLSEGKQETPTTDGATQFPLSEGKQETPTTDGATQFPLSESKQETPTTDGATQFPLSEGVRGSKDTPITPQYLADNGISSDNLIFSQNFLPYNPNLKEFSKSLRKARNLSEVVLWKELRADSFMGYSFYRQKPILNYIADFYCKELNLVIEIDGSSHDDKQAYDAERDRQMGILGLRVLRVSDTDVLKDIGNVLREIERFITPPNPPQEGKLSNPAAKAKGLQFSPEAAAVFDAGRELWRYYHRQPNCNVNASLYDIREHFQGRNDKGKMNNKSSDETYMHLIGNLREKLRQLSDKIEPKVYEYDFLKA